MAVHPKVEHILVIGGGDGGCVRELAKLQRSFMGTVIYTEEAFQCQRMHKRIIESFPISKIYQAHIPSYPSGHWLFGFASKNTIRSMIWMVFPEICGEYIHNIICQECIMVYLHCRHMWRSL